MPSEAGMVEGSGGISPAPPDDDAGLDTVQLQLDGFEGPLDLLLELARRQAVDLSGISVLDLADQYAAAVENLGRVGLVRASDWLVMAAWLTWLKSRLLLPKDPREAEQAREAAAALAGQLAAKERLRAALAFLDRQPRLGRDVWERGGGGARRAGDVVTARPELVSLLRACLVAIRAPDAGRYRTKLPPLWRVPDALARMRGLLAALADEGGPDPATAGEPRGVPLPCFLPPVAREPSRHYGLRCRAAVASTLLAGLELAREGEAALEQEAPFGAVRVGLPPGPHPSASAGTPLEA